MATWWVSLCSKVADLCSVMLFVVTSFIDIELGSEPEPKSEFPNWLPLGLSGHLYGQLGLKKFSTRLCIPPREVMTCSNVTLIYFAQPVSTGREHPRCGPH